MDVEAKKVQGIINRLGRCVLSFVLAGGLVGCATSSPSDGHDLTRVVQAWQSQSAHVVIEEAYTVQDALMVQLRLFRRDSPRSHLVQGQVSLIEDLIPVRDISMNPIRPLRVLAEDQWFVPEDAVSVPVVPYDFWLGLQVAISKAVTPTEDMTGAVVPNDGRSQVFYLDEGRIQRVPLNRKPSDVVIVKTYAPEDLRAVVVEASEAYLKKMDITERRFLVTMSLEEKDAPLFLWIDLDQQGIAGVSVVSSQGANRGVFTQSTQVVDTVFIDSHILGLLTRPVSSTYSLLAWTKGAAVDLLKMPIPDWTDGTFPPVMDNPGMDLHAFEVTLDKITGTRANYGILEYLIDGEDFFTHLTTAIQGARQSIDLRTFIFDNDDFAVAMADLIKSKSSEKDMSVRILLDGIGQIMGEGAVPRGLPSGFVSPSSMVHYLADGSNVKVRVRPNVLFKADHTKITVIDGQIGYTGGMNIGREYRYEWHDLMMAIRGPVLSDIQREFNVAWAHAGRWGDLGYLKERLSSSEHTVEGDGYPIRLLYTRTNVYQIYTAQLEAIKTARQYIFIHNAYFSDDTIISELIRARQRGVDVRVIMPSEGNHSIMNANNVIAANVMFKNGIRVYFYPGMSHVKAAIYDGWVCSGSANFDKLSLRDNMEMNVATSHPSVATDIRERLFERDFAVSEEMTSPLKSGIKEILSEILAEQL